MQTIVLKHVQVFVVNYFDIFQIFFFWDGGVGGWGQLYLNLFLDFWIFFIFTRSLNLMG